MNIERIVIVSRPDIHDLQRMHPNDLHPRGHMILDHHHNQRTFLGGVDRMSWLTNYEKKNVQG